MTQNINIVNLHIVLTLKVITCLKYPPSFLLSFPLVLNLNDMHFLPDTVPFAIILLCLADKNENEKKKV